MGNGAYNVALEYFQRTEQRQFQRSCATRKLCVHRCEHTLTKLRILSIFYVISAIGIIWPSQNPIVKPQSNDDAGSSGNGHSSERDLEQKNFHWDNGKKKNLMLSYI